jgi:hypothetical protein
MHVVYGSEWYCKRGFDASRRRFLEPDIKVSICLGRLVWEENDGSRRRLGYILDYKSNYSLHTGLLDNYILREKI